MSEVPRFIGLIADQVADAEAQWSLGTFGAIAEVPRTADEPVGLLTTENFASAVTALGGLRIEDREGMRPIAFETITTQAWSQRVAFCLPEAQAAMGRCAVLTELGPDRHALREQDRTAVLFDLGLDLLQVDACVRTADPELIAALRASAGRTLFDPANPAMGHILQHNPHRVFVTRCGRAEVYQGIPAPGGVAPDGPHTHVLPKLLAHKRTHAATEPIPSGWVSCAHLYPAHPLRDGNGRAIAFDTKRYVTFQRLLSRFGDVEHLRLKRNVTKAVTSGAGPKPSPGRTAASSRPASALRCGGSRHRKGRRPRLTRWFRAHDQGNADDELEEA